MKYTVNGKEYEEIGNEIMQEKRPEKVLAIINEYNGGKWGRSGQYAAIIKPHYFKNGNIKRQSFTVVEVVETIKKGYGYGGCNHSESICAILDYQGQG